MKTELKKAIVNFILDNEKEFQLPNATIKEFKDYIYNSKGQSLIGGEEVAEFIDKAIKLLTT